MKRISKKLRKVFSRRSYYDKIANVNPYGITERNSLSTIDRAFNQSRRHSIERHNKDVLRQAAKQRRRHFIMEALSLTCFAIVGGSIVYLIYFGLIYAITLLG